MHTTMRPCVRWVFILKWFESLISHCLLPFSRPQCWKVISSGIRNLQLIETRKSSSWCQFWAFEQFHMCACSLCFGTQIAFHSLNSSLSVHGEFPPDFHLKKIPWIFDILGGRGWKLLLFGSAFWDIASKISLYCQHFAWESDVNFAPVSCCCCCRLPEEWRALCGAPTLGTVKL